MPKVIPTIPDDLLLRELDSLPAYLPMIPKQLGMLLSRSTGQLEEDRKAGKGPKWTPMEGGVVRYFVGDVRTYLREHREHNTSVSTRDARNAKLNREAGFEVRAPTTLAFGAVEQFLIYADVDDVWPFAVVNGRTIDLFESLPMALSDQDDCLWLTLGEYMLALKDSFPDTRLGNSQD